MLQQTHADARPSTPARLFMAAAAVAQSAAALAAVLAALLAAVLAACLAVVAAPQALAADTGYVPPELKPWVNWVLEKHPEINCPRPAGADGPTDCVWVSSLELEVTAAGLGFDLRAQLYAPGLLVLPGDADSWPVQVAANGSAVPVVWSGEQPAADLQPGGYRLRGRIPWNERPDSLRLPPHIGLLTLRVNGQPVSRPTLSGGRLFLGEPGRSGTPGQPDSVKVEVFRHLVDGVPLRLVTYLRLQVAGASRIETLGRVLPADFAVTAIDAPVPARLQPDGNLQVQVEPGEYLLTVAARATQAVDALAMEARVPDWPNQEVWAFEPRRELRLVNVSGAASVDLAQVNAPFNVNGLQGYVLGADDTLRLTEQQRGDPNPAPGDIGLQRDLWLDFDGSGFVVRDEINAQLRRSSRLSAAYPLGSVTVDGVNQLVTQLGDGEPGVELSAGNHNVTAVSAVPRDAARTAVGWSLDASALSATLHLPPGWRLLWATGSDAAPTSWLARWTLWDLFVVILTLVLSWRYFGPGFTGLIGATLLIAYQEGSGLAIAWLVLLSLFVVLRYLDHPRLNRLVHGFAAIVAFFTVLSALGIAIDHARQGLYPQLSRYGIGGYGVGEPVPDYVQFEAKSAVRGRGVPESMPSAAPPGTREEREAGKPALPARPLPSADYPEGMQVQTGPGVPAWTWAQEPLIWNGPVAAGQPLGLTLLPPAIVRCWHALVALSVLSVTGLLLLPLLRTLPRLPHWLRPLAPQAVLMVVALGAWAPAGNVAAAVVDPDILKELEQRLLQAPQCVPGCASLGTVRVNLSDDNLELLLEIHTAAFVAVPIPGSTSDWSPSAIDVGGAPATVTGGGGQPLVIALQPGVHQVRLRGSLAQLEQAELRFPLRPALVEVNNRSSWQVQGLRNQRLARGSLRLERVRPRESSTAQSPEPTLQTDVAPAYVRVERELVFALDWRVATQVTRLAPAQGSFSVAIPLLPGEAVLDNTVNVSAHAAALVFGTDQSAMRWQSTLARADALELVAADIGEHQEVWAFRGSNLWHLHFTPSAGLVASTVAGRAGPVFYPRSGERLQVRPEATQPIPGASVTVHAVTLNETPGERIQTSELLLQIQASQGADYSVGLPPGAELTGVYIDEQAQPIGLRDGRVDLPLVTGRASYRIGWRRALPEALRFRTESVQLPGASSNITLATQFPANRWVLALGGPSLGPAIQVWGVVLVVALVGWLLTRLPDMPFRPLDALLLALGLTLCNFPTAVLVALWVLALRARAQWIERVRLRLLRNLVQLATAALTVIAVVALVSSVPMALLGSPDMQVSGNGSGAYYYRWYADHAVARLPVAWVFSLPLWVYRLAMLTWSLWLAFALMRWLRWAWRAWSTPQVWYPKAAEEGAGSAA